MKLNNTSLVRVLRADRGQALVMVPVLLGLLLAAAALVIDMANLFYSYDKLKSVTNAAALAGGAAMAWPSGNPTNTAYQYSGDPLAPAASGTTMYNANTNLNFSSAPVVTLGCVTSTAYELPPCIYDGVYNAIHVTESATVPTFFAKVFGVTSIPISATATASVLGGASGPWNVAIVVDTTGSMSTSDSDCGGISRLNCALNGIQTLLTTISPCPASATSCTATNAVDRVSLFTFPNVTTGSAAADYSCGTQRVSTQPYTFPATGATTYSPTGATYQILGYLNNYQVYPVPKSGPALSGSSNLVMAAGGASKCTGMQNPGGEDTYYAGVIYAAQASLIAEQTGNPNSKNAMIILTDGEAQATKNDLGSSATSNGTYPSYVNECGQAITAAQAAATAGTRVYTVAYGSQSSGCTTDTSGFSKGVTPCQTMQQMASDSKYFYSDYNQSGSGSTCQSASQPVTSLNDIFLSIGESLSRARLVPNTLWPSS